jgi:hypothetical protein
MEECIHGLDPSWCGVCLDKTRPKPAPVEIGPAIAAKYSGRCTFKCGGDIEPGDRIVSVDLAWAHEACAERELIA